MTERPTTGLLNSQSPVAQQESRVLLFGELLADRFPDEERIGGAPFNVARHLRAFGTHPVLISRIGQDDLAMRLMEHLGHWRMDQDGIQRDDAYPTGRVQVHPTASGHRFEILPNQAYDHIDAEIARLVVERSAPALVYFGTLIQRAAPSRCALKTLLQVTATPRILDLNLRPPWYDRAIVEESMLAADVLKLNLEELDVVAALLELPQASPEGHASELMSRFSMERVLVTAGAEGAWLLEADGDETRVPGQALTSMVDTVGAGDAFSAVFMLGMLWHWPGLVALQRASAFARAICGIRGAVPLDDSFYAPFLAEWEVLPEDPPC